MDGAPAGGEAAAGADARRATGLPVRDEAVSDAPRGVAIQRVLLVVAAYLLFRVALAAVWLPAATPWWVLAPAAALTALGSIGLPVAGIAALVRCRPSVPAAVGLTAAGLALWLGLAAVSRGLPPLLGAASAAAGDVGKILAAAGVGIALAAGIREPNILVPAGVFAAFADLVVVHFGTVKHALSHPRGQALVAAVSAAVPSVHARLPALTIGPADFLFLGIFLACAERFGMGLRRNAWILTAVLAVSLLAVPLLGPVPALAPMSAAFVAANWRRFLLTRQELASTVVVLVLAGALFAGYFLFMFPGRGR